MKTSELTSALLLSVALAGCGEPEKTMILIDPVGGCQYVGTIYGNNGVSSGGYVKPVTDIKGKQRCEVPHA